MNIPTRAARRLLAGFFATAILAPFATPSAYAHIAPCPYCGMNVTQDTPAQDNEVALKFGRKRVEYKCVFCALAEAQTEYKGDLSVLAPSEKKGEPIMLMRQGDKWSSMMEGAAFVLNEPLKHKVCNVQARAFTTADAAMAYMAANKDSFPNAQVLTLDALVKASGTDAGGAAKAHTNG